MIGEGVFALMWENVLEMACLWRTCGATSTLVSTATDLRDS